MYVELWIALLLCFLWYQVALEGFTSRWTPENKKDYSGNDIASTPGISLFDCKKKCIADSTCKGIVTDFTNGTGNCWTKNNWGTATDNDSRYTYKLSRT